MNKIAKAEFLDALIIVRMYVEQEEAELDMLKKAALPFVSENIQDFIESIGLSTRAQNILLNCCRQFFIREINWYRVPAHRIGEVSAIDIKRVRNSGKAVLSEIENAIKKHGISLKQ